MKLGVLFSGGKDSTYATYLAKKLGHKIECLITIQSQNQDSFMFHTPSIKCVEEQSKLMEIPLILTKTKGEKEKELNELEKAIEQAVKKYKIRGIVTGALRSEYQASRIQKICDKLKIKCINPLWHKDEIEYLKELINAKFKIIVTGVAAYPLDKSFLGRLIDKKFIDEVQILNQKYKIHPAGEGGEFETLVLNCSLFKRELKIKSWKDFGEKNSWRRELVVS